MVPCPAFPLSMSFPPPNVRTIRGQEDTYVCALPSRLYPCPIQTALSCFQGMCQLLPWVCLSIAGTYSCDCRVAKRQFVGDREQSLDIRAGVSTLHAHETPQGYRPKSEMGRGGRWAAGCPQGRLSPCCHLSSRNSKESWNSKIGPPCPGVIKVYLGR